MQKPLKII
jgi:hypothetical protein